MQDLNLIEVKVENISFENNIVIPGANSPVNIEVTTNISSVVKYDDNNARCKCATSVEIAPQNNDVDFKVFVCIVGIFEYGRDDDRKEIHIAACKKLFPHVQSRVTSFMTVVGFPNFVVEEPHVNVDDVEQN